MIISAIAAIDRQGLIGNGDKLPWHLPADLRRFRERTLGKPVIMGRRTFDSLRAPLPGRLNIVVTSSRPSQADGCIVAGSIEEALTIAEAHISRVGGNEVLMIGGRAIFEPTVPLWGRLILTVVEGNFQGDTYFPLDRVNAVRWRLVAQQFRETDAKNAHPCWFLELEPRGVTAGLFPEFDLRAWLSGQTDASVESPLKRAESAL